MATTPEASLTWTTGRAGSDGGGGVRGQRLDLELIQDGAVVETYTRSGAEGTQELSLAK